MPIETINSRLGIERSVASRAFLEVAANVLEQPVLRRVVKTWMVPGRRMDLAESAAAADFEPTYAHCPMVWLWPEPRDGQPLTNASQKATLNVSVRVYVASVDPLDALDVYGLIERAVHPETVAEGAALAERLGAITRWQTIELSQPGVVTLESSDGLIALAEGAVSLDYRLRGF